MATLGSVGLNILAGTGSLLADVTVTYTVTFANEQSVNQKVELLGVGANEPGQADILATLLDEPLPRPAGQSSVGRTVSKKVDLQTLNEDLVGPDEIQARVVISAASGQTQQVGFSNVQQLNVSRLLHGRS